MIGVLALQGNFNSHVKILEKINLNHKLVKTVDDLSSLDGLIIPGGESTTITNLLRRNQSLIDGINQLSQHKIPFLIFQNHRCYQLVFEKLLQILDYFSYNF